MGVRKNITRRILAVILMTVLLSMLYKSPAYADSGTSGSNIYVDKGVISFGTMPQNSYCNYREFRVTNTSDSTLSLIWNEQDPYGFINLLNPDSCTLGVGESTTFKVSINTGVAPGQYGGVIYITDYDNPGFTDSAYVQISATITDSKAAVTNVSVSPSDVTLNAGSNVTFSSVVTGVNDYTSAVEWSVSGQKSSSTYITSSGVLYISGDETADKLTITAVSKENPGVRGTANVKITKNNTNYSIYVIASPTSGGSVAGGGNVKAGDKVEVVASPYSGYSFDGWTLNGKKISDNSKFTYSDTYSDATLVANFKKNTCKINIDMNMQNAGTTSGDVYLNYGDSTTVTAKANSGYTFTGWMEDGKIISSSESFTYSGVTRDHYITACFQPSSYDVNVTVSPYGYGTVDGSGSYKPGSDFALTAKPAAGYKFSCWICNNNVVGRDTTLRISNINQDYNIVACFEEPGVTKYTIDSGVTSNNGTISPSGQYEIPEGANVMYTITPAHGYYISGVEVDGVSVGAVGNYTFSGVKDNHRIVAEFKPIQEENDNDDITEGYVTNIDGFDIENSGGRLIDEDIEDAAVSPGYDYDELTGVLQEMNITPTEALNRINNGKSDELFMRAMDDGTLVVSVYNELAPIEYRTAASYLDNQSIPNFPAVINAMLTDEEKIAILSGQQFQISLNVYDNSDFISPVDKKMIDEYRSDELNVVRYFDVVLLKANADGADSVDTISTPMKIVAEIPEAYRKDGREFYILRTHTDGNGKVSLKCLQDEDDNPNTITFTTDRFSSYAFAYSDGKKNSALAKGVKFGIVAGASLVVAIYAACKISDSKRRRRKK